MAVSAVFNLNYNVLVRGQLQPKRQPPGWQAECRASKVSLHNRSNILKSFQNCFNLELIKRQCSYLVKPFIVLPQAFEPLGTWGAEQRSQKPGWQLKQCGSLHYTTA